MRDSRFKNFPGENAPGTPYNARAYSARLFPFSRAREYRLLRRLVLALCLRQSHLAFGVQYFGENCGAKSLARETRTFQYGQRSGPSGEKWRNIEDKIHCTVSKLDETWLKYSLALYHYVKVQQLDDICEIRRQKANRRQNMAEIVFSWGVSEIKYIIFKENNDNSYEIHNNYVKLN